MDSSPIEIIFEIASYLDLVSFVQLASTCNYYRSTLANIINVNSSKYVSISYALRLLMPKLVYDRLYVNLEPGMDLSRTKQRRFYAMREGDIALINRLEIPTGSAITIVMDRGDYCVNPFINVSSDAISCNDILTFAAAEPYLRWGKNRTAYICPGLLMRARGTPKATTDLEPGAICCLFSSRPVKLKHPLNDVTSVGIYEGWTTPLNIMYMILYISSTVVSHIIPDTEMWIQPEVVQHLVECISSCRFNSNARLCTKRMFTEVISSMICIPDNDLSRYIRCLDLDIINAVIGGGSLLRSSLCDMHILDPCDYIQAMFGGSDKPMTGIARILVDLGVNSSGTKSEMIRKLDLYTSPFGTRDIPSPSSWITGSMKGNRIGMANIMVSRFVEHFSGDV